MSRKNSNVGRKNVRKDRRQRGEGRPPKAPQRPRTVVETMVVPDGRCFFRNRHGKARFATEEKARAGLRQAQNERARIGSGHVEKRFYACPEGGCGGFHLTSRESYDPTAWSRAGKDGAA